MESYAPGHFRELIRANAVVSSCTNRSIELEYSSNELGSSLCVLAHSAVNPANNRSYCFAFKQLIKVKMAGK